MIKRLKWARQQLRGRPENVSPKLWRRIIFNAWRRDIGPPWARSSLEFFIGHALRWLWLVPGVFLGLVSLYGQASSNASLQIAPAVIWPVILGGFLLAALVEHHGVRQERDELAEQPRVALNKHLAEGHALRDELADESRKIEKAFIRSITWVLNAKILVRRHAPAYYRQWEASVSSEDWVANQFLDAIKALDEICREIGVP